MISITLFGAAGRMGRVVSELLQQTDDIRIVHAVDRPGIDAETVNGLVVEEDSAKKNFEADVWVDVSLASSAFDHAKQAETLGIPILIGATGFSEEQVAVIHDLKNAHILAPNLSPGMNLLFSISPDIRRTLGETYDTAVFEMHHRHKKDAPSGSAKRLVEELENAGGKVQVTSLRLGEIVGEHRVIFASAGEEIEIIHRAKSREAFANGVAPAVRFLSGKTSGLYTMKEVLGL